MLDCMNDDDDAKKGTQAITEPTPPETTDLQVELPLPWSLARLLHKSRGPVYTSLVLIRTSAQIRTKEV